MQLQLKNGNLILVKCFTERTVQLKVDTKMDLTIHTHNVYIIRMCIKPLKFVFKNMLGHHHQPVNINYIFHHCYLLHGIKTLTDLITC